jgi:hypothetical protein
MRRAVVIKTGLVATIVLVCMSSALAQQIHYFPDFSTGASNLQMNGGAHLATWHSQKVLRLTDGYPGVGTFHPENTTSWFQIQQPINLGFTTYFKFQIHAAAICCSPADGFAFVIQNSSVTALGNGNGGLGYAGIPNSLAVEFDTHQDSWDPNANHVAVQSCGVNPNSPDHTGVCLVGSGINSSTNIPHLGVTCTSGPCTDGTTHEVVIEYDAPPSGTGPGTLTVWIDPAFFPTTHKPLPSAYKAINALPYNIDVNQNSQGITLAGGTSAWVGFSASQTTDPEAHDILAWEFSPHATSQVQQQIPPGGVTATYSFGQNDATVTYFPTFVNTGCDLQNPNGDPCLMTVKATPWDRKVFHDTRLTPGPFDADQCIVYEGTGGECIVYSITCQQKSQPTIDVPCPQITNPPPPKCTFGTNGCLAFSTSFYTLDNVTPTNFKYLKAHPVGSNNWQDISVFYDPSILDGRGGGTGGTPSDFVFVYNPRLP